MRKDVDIAQSIKLKSIEKVASELGLKKGEFTGWGDYKAKVKLAVWDRIKDRPDGKLILVTTLNPTKAGEGKTTMSIGLAQGLRCIGKKVLVGLREPSIGPTMGMKGGAAGGGYSQVLPMEDINLHFTGDIHAVTAAHNLLSAMINNSMFRGNPLHIDPNKIVWNRVMDIPDRALRNIVVGLGGKDGGIPHEDHFLITAASEVMAILCLSKDMTDLKKRLSRIIVAFDKDGKPVSAAQIKAVGAMALLLKDALRPNLVQTLEGGPAFIHGGPFANIAHGSSSIISTTMGLKLVDYFVTEAGFGSDLGAEKFFDIVCRIGDLKPNAVVLVATVKGLKVHGGHGGKQGSLGKGFANLEKHLENLRLFNIPVIVAINVFADDTEEDLHLVEHLCRDIGVECARCDVHRKGGEGAKELAQKIVKLSSGESRFKPLYGLELSLKEKIECIANQIYGAKRVVYTVEAERALANYEALGFSNLPICMAKTQFSLSDDPKLVGRPEDFQITVRDVNISAGAGFIVPLTGTISTMPGLPKEPAAEKMDIDEKGKITGLF
jgi:formate--tetrahydrofolate ligase